MWFEYMKIPRDTHVGGPKENASTILNLRG